MDSTTPEIKKFVQKLNTKFNPEKIILFGSRATGKAWKQSDYDFIIVSSLFQKVPWLERISKVVRLWDLPVEIDILPYTPQEFNRKKKESSLLRKALKEGKRIAQ